MTTKEKLKYVFLKLLNGFRNGIYDFEDGNYIPIKECLGDDGLEYALFCSQKGFDICILKTIVEETRVNYVNVASNEEFNQGYLALMTKLFPKDKACFERIVAESEYTPWYFGDEINEIWSSFIQKMRQMDMSYALVEIGIKAIDDSNLQAMNCCKGFIYMLLDDFMLDEEGSINAAKAAYRAFDVTAGIGITSDKSKIYISGHKENADVKREVLIEELTPNNIPLAILFNMHNVLNELLFKM